MIRILRFRVPFRSRLSVLLVAGLNLGVVSSSWAQLSNFQAQYFQAQYLVNPAMAGLEGGLKINVGYQLLSTGIAGSPNAKFTTGEYSFGNKVGIGFLVNADQAGLIARTRVMGTYAYHLPLNETDKLSFGLSLGINSTHFQADQVVGDSGDQSAAQYNARPVYVDGDFGIAYTGSQLSVQAAVPNLRSLFFKSADQSLAPYRSDLFIAIGYRLPFTTDDNSTTLEPKLAYRGFKNIDGVLDIGANLSMLHDRISLGGMYHTNQSMSLAAGLGVKQVGVVFSYTNDLGPFKTYAANTFELGLKFNLLASPAER